MFKKFVSIALVIVFALTAVLLSACGDDDPSNAENESAAENESSEVIELSAKEVFTSRMKEAYASDSNPIKELSGEDAGEIALKIASSFDLNALGINGTDVLGGNKLSNKLDFAFSSEKGFTADEELGVNGGAETVKLSLDYVDEVLYLVIDGITGVPVSITADDLKGLFSDFSGGENGDFGLLSYQVLNEEDGDEFDGYYDYEGDGATFGLDSPESGGNSMFGIYAGADEIKAAMKFYNKLGSVIAEEFKTAFEGLDESLFVKGEQEITSGSLTANTKVVTLTLDAETVRKVLKDVLLKAVDSEEFAAVIGDGFDASEAKTEIDEELAKLDLAITVTLCDSDEVKGFTACVQLTYEEESAVYEASALSVNGECACVFNLSNKHAELIDASFEKLERSIKFNFAITADGQKLTLNGDLASEDGKVFSGEIKAELPESLSGNGKLNLKSIALNIDLTLEENKFGVKLNSVTVDTGMQITVPTDISVYVIKNGDVFEIEAHAAIEIENTIKFDADAKLAISKLDSFDCTAPAESQSISEFVESFQSGGAGVLMQYLSERPILYGLIAQLSGYNDVDPDYDDDWETTEETYYYGNEANITFRSDGTGVINFNGECTIKDGKMVVTPSFNDPMTFDASGPVAGEDGWVNYTVNGKTFESFEGTDFMDDRYVIYSWYTLDEYNQMFSAYYYPDSPERSYIAIAFSYTVSEDGVYNVNLMGGDFEFVFSEYEDGSYSAVYSYKYDPEGNIYSIIIEY
ncbi:MAG: hypothetical protein J5793_05025 [Clostridia bacterium]|nr:hypothetical protein [Clostridia bacterium]